MNVGTRINERIDWVAVALLPVVGLVGGYLAVAIGSYGAGTKVLTVVAGLALAAIAALAPVRVAAPASVCAALAAAVLVPYSVLPNAGAVKYAGLGAGVLCALAWVRTRQPVRGWGWFALSLLAFLPATMLDSTSLTSDYELRLLMVAMVLTVPVVALVSTFDEQQRLWVARAVVALASVESVYALVEFTQRRTPLWYSFASDQSYGATAGTRVGLYNNLFDDGSLRAQGTLGHPLLLGLLAAVAFVLLVTWPVVRTRLVRWPLAALLFSTFAVAGTRTFIVVVPLVVIFFASRRVKVSAGRLLAGIYLSIVLLLALWFAGVFSSGPVQHLLGSDSVTHRSSIMGAFGTVIRNQDPVGLVIGEGYLTQARLFATGVIQVDSGLRVIDNQLMSTLAMAGFVGLAALLVTLWKAVRAADSRALALLATVVATFFSFDVYLWPSSLLMVALAVGMCRASGPSDDVGLEALRAHALR